MGQAGSPYTQRGSPVAGQLETSVDLARVASMKLPWRLPSIGLNRFSTNPLSNAAA